MESGTRHTSYASPMNVTSLKAMLNDQQRAKLLVPSIRPAKKAFGVPRRVYSSDEIEIRRSLAEMLAVDRFTIDIDQPLLSTGITREQFVLLMKVQAKRHKIPIQQSFLDQLADEEHWATTVKKLTISELASFIFDKFMDERQWDRD